MKLSFDALQTTSLTKTDLSETLAGHMGVTQRESRELVEGFFELLAAELARGESVKLAQFGNFNVRRRGARLARNPRTSEPAMVGPRRTVTFTGGPKLRSLLHAQNTPPTGEREGPASIPARGIGARNDRTHAHPAPQEP